MHKPFDIGFAAISYDEWASANDVFFGNLEFHILRSEKEVSWKRISFEEKLVWKELVLVGRWVGW